MTDIDIMKIAIEEANKAFSKSNFPVGAVLLINRQIIDKSHNQNKELGTLHNHAENSLLIKHSGLLKESTKRNDFIEIYTTLEPCLYCFGGILQHNVKRLVFSVSDPVVGACALLPNLGEWYIKKNIETKKGVLLEEYLPILFKYNERCKKYDWNKLIEHNKMANQ